MSIKPRLRAATVTTAMALVAVSGQSLLAGSAEAVTTTKVSLTNGQLSVEGQGGIGGTFVAVESTTSVAGARVDTDGRFKVQAIS